MMKMRSLKSAPIGNAASYIVGLTHKFINTLTWTSCSLIFSQNQSTSTGTSSWGVRRARHSVLHVSFSFYEYSLYLENTRYCWVYTHLTVWHSLITSVVFYQIRASKRDKRQSIKGRSKRDKRLSIDGRSKNSKSRIWDARVADVSQVITTEGNNHISTKPLYQQDNHNNITCLLRRYWFL